MCSRLASLISFFDLIDGSQQMLDSVKSVTTYPTFPASMISVPILIRVRFPCCCVLLRCSNIYPITIRGKPP